MKSFSFLSSNYKNNNKKLSLELDENDLHKKLEDSYLSDIQFALKIGLDRSDFDCELRFEFQLHLNHVPYIFSFLEKNRQITKLTLDCDVTPAVAKAIAEALRKNTSLRVVNLKSELIGGEGASHLVSALETNQTLEEISLEGCDIGDEGVGKIAIALQSALKINITFHTLNLRSNKIGDKGAIALADILKTDTSLKKLNLYQNKIGNEGAIEIANALTDNTTLQNLDLGSNYDINQQGEDALEQAVQKNTTLLSLSTSKRSFVAEKNIQALKNKTPKCEIPLTAPIQNAAPRENAKSNIHYTPFDEFDEFLYFKNMKDEINDDESVSDKENFKHYFPDVGESGSEGDDDISDSTDFSFFEEPVTWLKSKIETLTNNIKHNDSSSDQEETDNEESTDSDTDEIDEENSDNYDQLCSIYKENCEESPDELDLQSEFSFINEKLIKAIFQFLNAHPTITKLRLVGYKIKPAYVKVLGDELKNNTTLKSLDLYFNRLGDKGVCKLASALEGNSTLQELILEANDMGDKGAEALANALKKNKTLQNLNLQENNIGDKGAKALAEALERNKGLKKLNLCGNQICDSGVCAIADALNGNVLLNSNIILENLNLSYQTHRLSAKKKTSTQRYDQKLGLYIDTFSEEGAFALAKTLKQNSTLKSLNISNNHDISEKGAIAIAKALEKNDTLTKLNFSNNNNINDQNAIVIAGILEKNKNIEKFKLNNKNIGVTILKGGGKLKPSTSSFFVNAAWQMMAGAMQSLWSKSSPTSSATQQPGDVKKWGPFLTPKSINAPVPTNLLESNTANQPQQSDLIISNVGNQLVTKGLSDSSVKNGNNNLRKINVANLLRNGGKPEVSTLLFVGQTTWRMMAGIQTQESKRNTAPLAIKPQRNIDYDKNFLLSNSPANSQELETALLVESVMTGIDNYKQNRHLTFGFFTTVFEDYSRGARRAEIYLSILKNQNLYPWLKEITIYALLASFDGENLQNTVMTEIMTEIKSSRNKDVLSKEQVLSELKSNILKNDQYDVATIDKVVRKLVKYANEDRELDLDKIEKIFKPILPGNLYRDHKVKLG